MRIGPSRHVSMDEAHLGSIRTKYVLKPCNLNQDRDNRTLAVPTEPTECSPGYSPVAVDMSSLAGLVENPRETIGRLEVPTRTGQAAERLSKTNPKVGLVMGRK